MLREFKDISTSSGGTFTLPAFGAAGIRQPHVIVSPVEHGLVNAARIHNALHTDPAQHADVAALRAVYRRGTRSYKPKRHGSSRRQWGMRRVHAHLSHLATGKRPNARYTRDDDLLPAGHPHAISTKAERKALVAFEGRREPDQAAPEPVTISDLARIAYARKAFVFDALEVKGAWDPDLHPRDSHGLFASIGADVDAMIGGKQQSGTIVGVRGDSVKVRTAGGVEKTVKAKDTTVTGHGGTNMTLMEHAQAHSVADKRARQLTKAGHPEASAWQKRASELGDALQARAAGKSPEDLAAELRGEKPARSLDAINKDMAAANRTYKDAHAAAVAAGRDPLRDKATMKAANDVAAVLAERDQHTMRSTQSEPTARPDGTQWGSGFSPGDPRTDPAYDKYVSDLDTRIQQAQTQTGTTKDIYQDPTTGAYSPERQALHDQILDKYLTQYAAIPKDRRAVVLAGPSGAGKSTLIKKKGHEFGVESDAHGNPTNFARIDPDELKSDLIAAGVPDAYRTTHGLGDGEMAALLHDESSHLADRLRGMVIGHGTNIMLDGTLAGDRDKQADKVKALRGAGYSAHGVLVNGDIETSLTWAGKRHTKGEAPVAGTPLAGRYVPLSEIAKQRPSGQFSDMLDAPHLSASSENFEHIAPTFDAGVRVYDNSGSEPRLQYAEEPATPPSHAAGLDDARLAALHGGIGEPTAGHGPARIAAALSKAVQDGEPHAYTHPGGTVQATPDGHVTMTGPDGSRQEMPTPDVESLVDHYSGGNAKVQIRAGSHAGAAGHHITGKDGRGRKVAVFVPGERSDAEAAAANIRAGRSAFDGGGSSPRSGGEAMQLPRPRRTTPLPNGAAVIHEDGREGTIEHVRATNLAAGDELIHPTTGAAVGKVASVTTDTDGFKNEVDGNSPIGSGLRRIKMEGDEENPRTSNAGHFTRFKPSGGGSPRS